MNELRQRSERLLAEPWLDRDRDGVEAIGRRIRARRRRVAGGCLVVVLVLVGALVTIRTDETSSLRVGDRPTSDYGPDDVRVVVFLDPGAPADDVELVERGLVADPLVGQAWVLTQDDAYAQFECLFRDAPEMIESVTPAILPTSFQIALVDGARTDDLQLARTKVEPVRVVHTGPRSAAEAQAEQLTGTSRPTDPACRGAIGRPIK